MNDPYQLPLMALALEGVFGFRTVTGFNGHHGKPARVTLDREGDTLIYSGVLHAWEMRYGGATHVGTLGHVLSAAEAHSNFTRGALNPQLSIPRDDLVALINIRNGSFTGYPYPRNGYTMGLSMLAKWGLIYEYPENHWKLTPYGERRVSRYLRPI